MSQLKHPFASRVAMGLPVAATLGLCLVASAAPKTAALRANPRPAPRLAPRASSDYLLGPDDVLDISVSNHSDLNTSVTVRSDGKITLPRAGDVLARGKSASQLAREIQGRLERTLNNARVQVFLKQARPRLARITGAVGTAGAYALKPGWRVMDLVAQAGGLSTKATRVTGRVIRAGRSVPLDIARAIAQPGSPANLALRPDDLVMLDARDYAKQITVMGNVAHPGAYDLDEDLHVSDLLAQAGGPLSSAALRKAEVLRRGQPVLRDLSGLVAGDVPPDSPLARFTFQAGDVLNVPENLARFGVMGQVNKPSYYPLPENESEATVLKALSQASGALADGDLAHATITRTQNGQSQIIPVNAALMLAGKAPDNVILRADDVLLVPKRIENMVQVIGQVSKPGSYPLEDGEALLTLMAQAGNPINGAGLSRAYILRNGQQIPLNLRAALVDHQVDSAVSEFVLQPGDVLNIPDVSGQIQVNGQVGKPGAYSLDDDLTMMTLLSNAGNPTQGAALSQAYVLRGGRTIAFDLRGTVEGNIDPAVASFRFAPGDVLVVPQNKLLYAVIGQVSKPGYYPFPEDPTKNTILTALTQAGGPTQGNSANLVHAGILRTVNGQQTVIEVNLDQLFKKGTLPANARLQPNDVLYIPSKKTGGIKVTDILGPLSILTRL